ncbi:MAG: hypothetical protein MK212_17505 [Saprospiraceae bacterium]|nr:hypothetical protein [Saprospiraceae bacterium]
MFKTYQYIPQLLFSQDPNHLELGLQLINKFITLLKEVKEVDSDYNTYQDQLSQDEFTHLKYRIKKKDIFSNEIIILRYFTADYIHNSKVREQIDYLLEEIVGKSYQGNYTSMAALNEMYYRTQTASNFVNEIYYNWFIDFLATFELSEEDRLHFTQLLRRYTRNRHHDVQILCKTYLLNHASPQEVVKLTNSTRVTLKINDDYLVKIPETWQRLTMLRHLDLSNMTFAQIPNNFDLFPNLRTLNLYGFRIANQYEPELIKHPTDAFASIEALPNSIQALQQLKELNLSRISLGRLKEPIRLPDWLGQFKNLETLYLPFCYLESYPTQLTQLKTLKNLHVPYVAAVEDLGYDYFVYSYDCVIYCDGNQKYIKLSSSYFEELLPSVNLKWNHLWVSREDFYQYKLL